MLTPLICAIAGADKVLALTRDSHYGTAQIVCEKTLELAKKWGVDNKIDMLFSREDKSIGDADIVTNLGFVRPLNAPFLSRLKRSVLYHSCGKRGNTELKI